MVLSFDMGKHKFLESVIAQMLDADTMSRFYFLNYHILTLAI